MTIQDRVYRNIVNICSERGIKIGWLESKCGVARGYFVRICERQTDFRALALIKACEILGVSIDEVVYK